MKDRAKKFIFVVENLLRSVKSWLMSKGYWGPKGLVYVPFLASLLIWVAIAFARASASMLTYDSDMYQIYKSAAAGNVSDLVALQGLKDLGRFGFARYLFKSNIASLWYVPLIGVGISFYLYFQIIIQGKDAFPKFSSKSKSTTSSDEIAKLHELKQSGAISQDEYEMMKKKVIHG